MGTKEIKGLEYFSSIEEVKQVKKDLIRLRDKMESLPEYLLLFGKTQMFYDGKGRSRGGHSANIALTSKNMASKAFKRIYKDKNIEDEELYNINQEIIELKAEIIGLSHDLGHTPLGHDGENVLNKKLYQMTAEDPELFEQISTEREELFSEITMDIDEETSKKLEKKGFKIEAGTYAYEKVQQMKREQKADKGIGFEHNEYGAQIFSRIFDELKEELAETEYVDSMEKLDKNEFMEGILAHSRSRFPAIPDNFLSQIVRQADKIEYMNYDFDEYQQMGCFDLEDEHLQKVLSQRLEKSSMTVDEMKEYMALTGEERREILEEEIIDEALGNGGKINDNMQAIRKSKICAEFKDDMIFYIAEDGKRGLITGNNVERQETILSKLIEFYRKNPDRIPQDEVRTKISPLNENETDSIEVSSFVPERVANNSYEQVKAYIVSLTNEKCEDIYQELVEERIRDGKGHGITPVTEKEIKQRMEHFQNKSLRKDEKLYSRERSQDTYSYLPQNIKELIEKNRAIHKEEMREDRILEAQMTRADRKRKAEAEKVANIEAERIAYFHDQRSEAYFIEEEIRKVSYSLEMIKQIANSRRQERVAVTTNETLKGVKEEYTRDEVMVGEER